MDSQHTAGIRITGDAKGAVDAHRAVAEEQRKLAEQTSRTNAVARLSAEESRRFVEALRAKALALANVRQESVALEAASRVLERAMGRIVGVISGTVAGGIVGALSTAALGFVSFGRAADEAADRVEDAVERARKALATLPGDRPSGEYLSAELQAREEERRGLYRLQERMGGPGSLGPREAVRLLELDTEIQRIASVLSVVRPEPAEPHVAGPDKELLRQIATAARERERLLAQDAANWVRDTEKALGAAQDLVYTWTEGGERIAIARREWERIVALQEKGAQQFTDALIAPLVAGAQAEIEAAEELIYTWDSLGNRVTMSRRDWEERQRWPLEDQDARIREAMEARGVVVREAARSAELFEQAVATGIMTGMRRGSGTLGEHMRRVISDAMFTAFMTPIATQIARPFGAVGSSLAGLGFGGPQYVEDAAGNVSVAQQSGLGAFLGQYGVPILLGMSAVQQYRSGDRRGAVASAGLGAAGYAFGGPVGAAVGFMAGSLFGSRGQTTPRHRHGIYAAGFGAAGGINYDPRHPHAGSNEGIDLSFISAQEQNLIRNLALSPDQVARISAALPRDPSYFFGPEGSDWRAGAQQLMTDRLQAASSVLGHSIEHLTRVMSMSAEQFQETVKQMEETLQGQRDALAGSVRGLPGQLGITRLEDYQRALSLSEGSPADRLATARGFYDATLARARGGDLSAVHEFAASAQTLLGLGRDVYASGGGFQDLFREVNTALSGLLGQQRGVQAEILRDVPLTIIEASQDQIAELKRGFDRMVSKLDQVESELRRWRNTS